MEAGGEDLQTSSDGFTVTTEPHDLAGVRAALEEKGAKTTASDLVLVAQNTVPITDPGESKRVLRLLDALDDHDDVQNVYANFDIADDLLAAYEG
jgi:transcriptional/translational regulatory protein YebC/TACO1